MIFELHYALIMAGYSAAGLLLGRFFIMYGGASQFELGLVFMIQPATAFTRPLISAKADRDQSHKRLLCYCLFVNSISYIPFIVVPYLLDWPSIAPYLSLRVNFWIFVVGHFFGSVAFCGVRTLGDTLAVNYAKRNNGNFATYRKFGAMSFGICAYLLGFINENWVMPDYVPTQITNVVALFLLMLFVYFWPDEDFLVFSESQMRQAASCDATPAIDHALHQNQKSFSQYMSVANSKPLGTNSKLSLNKFEHYGSTETSKKRETSDNNKLRDEHYANEDSTCRISDMMATSDHVSTSQQLKILWVLVRRDFRIPLYLGLVFYGGFVGYAPPNYVFTYMGMVCDETKQCDGAFLSGLTMITYCCAETTFYVIVKKLGNRVGHLFKIEITLLSLTFHYLFYGLALSHLSPYFFLIESLHGLEYSISLTSSVELAYQFANEIELIMPELLRKGIVGPDEDREKVKVSLIATMNSLFTLVYDGLGTIVGVLIYGIIIEDYSYPVAFTCIGCLAFGGFLISVFIVLIGKCLNIQPQILKYLQQPTTTSTLPRPLAAESNESERI